MARPYATLRGQLVAHDLQQTDLARKLLISSRTATRKLCGHYPWTLDEMYDIMGLLEWPYDRMHELFPRNGIATRSA
jgi:hypothetical protein